jgi:hypothetical protein
VYPYFSAASLRERTKAIVEEAGLVIDTLKATPPYDIGATLDHRLSSPARFEVLSERGLD